MIQRFAGFGLALLLLLGAAGCVMLQPAARVPGADALALEDDGRLEEAARIYRQVLTGRPQLVLAWVNLGNVLAAQGLHSEAEQAYATALDHDPDHVDALNNLAWLRLTTGGDLEDARELALRATAQVRPDPFLALDTLARIELELGHCEAAAAAFGEALEAAPEGSSARDEILQGLDEVERVCRRPAPSPKY